MQDRQETGNEKTTDETQNPSNKQRIQCHFVSNTHWDREWRYSMQRIRFMLVYLMDMLLDILEKEPEFKSFHLDSQTVPLQDYLEIRPERREQIEKYIMEGRLLVGPWFCLPDEFSISGESLLRNLLLGHKIAKSFGKVTKTGYSPFSWGQISQMPQIYKGFGIPFAAFYRGINTLVAPRSEVVWEGADGTRVIASRLGLRPRYNVWYVIQRPAYWNQQDVDDRNVEWGNGHGPFRMIDQAHGDLDSQYAHTRNDYFKENIAERAHQGIEEQNEDWTTPHRFWSCGHDSSCPDIREVRMIADCKEALSKNADVFHSTFADFQKGVCDNVADDLPVVKGEMRHGYCKGSTSVLFGWIISARMDVKQANFRTERGLMNYAEPMSVFASMCGTEYPQGFLDNAFNLLLQNHGHDSIGGCSRDVINDDMLYRYRQVADISSCLTEQALMDITRSIDLSAYRPEDMALVVFNPASFARSEVGGYVLDIPRQWEAKDFEIVDEAGIKVPLQICGKGEKHGQIVQAKNDGPNVFGMTRYNIRAEFDDVPAMGYKTFFVKGLEELHLKQPKSLLTDVQTMENEFIAVTINPNGTLTVKDKATGKVFDRLGYFRDASEIGNPWEHHTVANEEVYTTLNERATVALVRAGELETAFRVTLDWALPAGRTKDDKHRVKDFQPYRIVNTVTLRKGQKWVEIVTEVDNNVEDHYLQVSFPTALDTRQVSVQGQFDVIQRPIEKPDYSLYEEIPQSEHPMNSFVDVSDGQNGLALLNEGLKAYEAHDDSDNTVSLTLLRCFPLRICVTQEMTDYSDTDKGTQCLGKHTFKYAVMPHVGNWEKAGLWQSSESFNLAFVAAQVGPTKNGTEALQKSFLELAPDNLHVSAIKRNENNTGWIVRLFNPFGETINGKLRFNAGFTGTDKKLSPVEYQQTEFTPPSDKGRLWNKVRLVTLEEIPQQDLEIDRQGWVGFEITTKKILTIEFLA